jgi:alkylated DNA repair dioxygenase AlkB
MQSRELAPGVVYAAGFVAQPDDVLEQLLEDVEFQQRERRMYGRVVKTPRLEAWYGPAPYRFGGSELPARELPPVLRALALRLEAQYSGLDFCGAGALVNLYRDGQDTVAGHADDEPEMEGCTIASLNFGVPRDFFFRRKARGVERNPSRLKVELEPGSLLMMNPGVQEEWEHCRPRRKRVTQLSVNVTFRALPVG